MKNRFILYHLISKFFFTFIITISIFSFNKCEITNELLVFKRYNIYVTNCSDEDLFVNKTCVPISTKETDINDMFDRIVSYYKNISNATIENKTIIEGEGINYIITTNIIENNANSLLNLGDCYSNSVMDIDPYFYIVLIYMIDSNYMTTSNGIRIFNSNGETHLLSELCGEATINIGIPIQMHAEDKTLYKNIKEEYRYDIFNPEDPFFNDKCTKFTTSFNSDITLKKRNELYLININMTCSDKCLYDKFDENNNIIYCNCNFGGESKMKNEIESERFNIKVIKCIKKSFNNIMKNYIFFVICILSFSFIICFFITCTSLSSTISKYSKDFSKLKTKFLNLYSEIIEKKEKKMGESGKSAQNEIINLKNKKKLNEIDDNDNGNDNGGEQDEESEGGFIINLQKNNNKNKINQFKNPFGNSFPNNPFSPYNAYNPIFQYQMYQQYMMNYMNYLNSNNNAINNNRNEDEGDSKRNGKKGPIIINLDYDKIKEYALKMMKVKEQKNINNIQIFKRNKKRYFINKPYPPKNSKLTERELMSSGSKIKDKLDAIFDLNNDKEKEDSISEQKEEDSTENKNNIKKYKKNNTEEKEKRLSSSDKNTNNKKKEIIFGSDEFYKMLKEIPDAKKLEFFKEPELNLMEYQHACTIDTRMFFQIYSSILKEQNNLILSLSLCSNDYNFSSLKFSFLCIQIILYLTVSAIFFNDSIIDKIYENENKFKISYMKKPIAFTFIICLVINLLLKTLIKMNNNVIDIKYGDQTFQEGVNAIRLKLIFYFFIGFIIIIGGSCLLTSFCSIFINSQIKLIECALFALLFNFVASILFCFIITGLRTCSMNGSKSKTSCLYATSNILTYL